MTITHQPKSGATLTGTEYEDDDHVLTDFPPTLALPIADTTIIQGDPTTNYSTATTLAIADRFITPAYGQFPIIQFDLTDLAGKTVIRAPLILTTIGDGSISYNGSIYVGAIGVRKILVPTVVTQATWNVYSTGNSWTSAGAQSPLDAEANWVATQFWTSSAYGRPGKLIFDLADVIQDALANSETTLSVMVGTATATGSQNPIVTHSMESSTTASRPSCQVVFI